MSQATMTKLVIGLGLTIEMLQANNHKATKEQIKKLEETQKNTHLEIKKLHAAGTERQPKVEQPRVNTARSMNRR